MQPRRRSSSVYGKLMRVVVATLSVVSFATLIVVALLSIYSSDRSVKRIEREIREGIQQKGTVLIDNSGVALESLVAENAISSVQELTAGAVAGDPDVVYGAFVGSDGKPWAFVSPTSPDPRQTDGAALVLVGRETSSLGQSPSPQVTRRTVAGFDQEIIEFRKPVLVEREYAGMVVYGLSTQRMNLSLAEVKRHGTVALLFLLLALVVVVVANLGFGLWLVRRAARRITEPLGSLSGIAERLASGERGVRAQVETHDEIEALGEAFNRMACAVEERESELRLAVDAAREAIRVKNEFLANVSHELRTPLNAIINMPAALLRDYREFLLLCCSGCEATYEAPAGASADADPEEVCPACAAPLTLQRKAFFVGDATEHYSFQQQVLRCARHLHNLVTDILDFSKADADRVVLTPKRIDVYEMVVRGCEPVRMLASARGVHLHINKPEEPFALVCDTNRMAQILVNVVGNAVKFTDPGGHINVDMLKDGDHCLFQVKDTGIGIPKEFLTTIFESFRQVDGGHTRAYGGTGLGLAITKKLVEAHRGLVWAESEEGKGSEFFIRVPLEGPEHEGLKEAPRPREAGVARKVLVVDDDCTAYEIASTLLVPKGFHVDHVSDSTRVLGHVSTNRPDLIILDMMMPTVSGLSVLRDIRGDEALAELPVIVSTAYGGSMDVIEELGASWLPKPWEEGSLVDAVVSVFGDPDGGAFDV